MRNNNNGVVVSTASHRGSRRSSSTTSTYYTSGFFVAASFILLSLQQNDGVHGFTAKLAPPWTAGGNGGGGGGGNRITTKRRKKQQDVKLLIQEEASSSSSALKEKDEDEEIVALSSSSSEEAKPATSIKEDDVIKSTSSSSFPSEESTLKAAREYSSAANAAVLLSKELDEHMKKQSSPTPARAVGAGGAPPMPAPSTSMRLRSHTSRVPSSKSGFPSGPTSPGTSTTLLSSTSLSSTPQPSSSAEILPHLPSLLKMCRLSNLPGIFLFHVLGIYLSLQSTITPSALAALTGTNKMHLFLQILTKPSMVCLLFSTILISVTSMVVNDYYDAKSGVDQHNILYRPESSSPLASGIVPFAAAKRFLVRLYAALLVAVTFVPGVPARLCVMGSTLITYWYTQHIKPKTWTKNVAVSTIIAMTPFASGSACAHLLPALGVGGGGGQWEVFKGTARLFATLFAGFMGREIFMDIRDCEGDGMEGIPTLPVKYGRRFASRVACGWTVLSAFLVAVGPLVQVLMGTLGGGTVEMVSTGMKRLVLAMVGGALVVNGSLGVVVTEGANDGITKNAIETAKIAILFFLGSFV